MRVSRGFTLIELLITIAILGVLAVVVVVAINPVERSAQGRDTGRIAAVVQIGHAITAYYSQHSTFPATATWAQDLLTDGALTTFPNGTTYPAYGVTPCTTFVQPGSDPTYCYDLDATNGALVFARAEANAQNGKCTLPQVAYFVYSLADGHGGTICSAADPTPWVGGSQAYAE